MGSRPIYKVVIELSSGGRWEKHFIGRPTIGDLVPALEEECTQRVGPMGAAGQNIDKTRARYRDYTNMVKLFWPAGDGMAECHSCGTYVGGIVITKEIVAIDIGRDPGKGAA